jgi:hypothetical protein
MIFYLVSLAAFIFGLIERDQPYGLPIWIAGLVNFLVYPFYFELFLNIKAKCCKNRHKHDCIKQLSRVQFPLVYSDGYNVTFCGAEKLHPFDS